MTALMILGSSYGSGPTNAESASKTLAGCNCREQLGGLSEEQLNPQGYDGVCRADVPKGIMQIIELCDADGNTKVGEEYKCKYKA